MFQIKLFGYFRMSMGEMILDEGILRSDMLLRLLVYLLIFHDKSISNTELEKYLWSSESVEKPKDALKNLVCRLRNVLDKTFGKRDLILTGRGNYRWNPAYSVELDIENFQILYEKFKNEELEKEDRIDILQNALKIYGGMFLTQQKDDHFVSNYCILYHSMYLNMVEQLYAIYFENEEYRAAEMVCNQALTVDKLDGHLNIYKVRALVKQGKISIAEQHYKTLERMIRLNMNVKGSNLLRDLKREMAEYRGNSFGDMQSIQADIQEHQTLSAKDGSFFCSYEEFKGIYILQARKNHRGKVDSYVILFSLEMKNTDQVYAEDVSDFLIKMAMDDLGELLARQLRECDAVSSCSQHQYIAMLDQCSYENTLSIANRIREQYVQTTSAQFVNIMIDMQKIQLEEIE